MRLTIAERFRPFSHRPGMGCLLPGTALEIRAFPSRLQIFDLSDVSHPLLGELSWNTEGRVQDFTVLQDLEQGSVVVWGQAPVGYFRLRLRALSDRRSLVCHWERIPELGLEVQRNGDWTWSRSERERLWEVSDRVQMKEVWVGSSEKRVPYPSALSFAPVSRLSLGSHKKQDWDGVERRLDLKEILPIWHRLGGLAPDWRETGGLRAVEKVLEGKDPTAVVPAMEEAFLAGFNGILVPQERDLRFLGLAPVADKNPLALLPKGAGLIESLFVRSTDSDLHLLPLLPPEFHCGRLLGQACSDWAELDLEWSKKRVRRAILRVKRSGTYRLRLPSGEQAFRLRANGRDQGRQVQVGDPLDLQEGQHYFLDNFTR